MKLTTASADKFAIGFSALCVIHCFATPVLLLLLPAATLANLNPEAFHFWMVVAVIPTSIYAFSLGCQKHRQLHIAVIALVGLVTLVSSVILGEHVLGEIGEKVVTTIGAAIIAYAHYQNFTLCKQDRNQQQSSENS